MTSSPKTTRRSQLPLPDGVLRLIAVDAKIAPERQERVLDELTREGRPLVRSSTLRLAIADWSRRGRFRGYTS